MNGIFGMWSRPISWIVFRLRSAGIRAKRLRSRLVGNVAHFAADSSRETTTTELTAVVAKDLSIPAEKSPSRGNSAADARRRPSCARMDKAEPYPTARDLH